MSQPATKSACKYWSGLLPTVLLILLLAVPALADVVTLRPDGVSVAGSWTGVTAANLNDNSDATFATITTTLSTFQVTMANNAAYAGATINSVTLYARATTTNGAGNASNTEMIDFGAGAVSGTPISVSRAGAYSSYSKTAATLTTPALVDGLVVHVATTKLQAGEILNVADVWAVVDYTPAAGNNTITSCDGCHLQPPLEAANRTSATGAVVGSHAAHSVYACTICHPNNAVLNHRGGGTPNGTEGRIEMLANIQGGTYSKGAGFNQANDLTGASLGTCTNVSCHGTATTPKWGTPGGLACNGCHGAPPNTNAHPEHYAAKGWGATDTAGVYCVECHPDNTVTHSNVADGVVIIEAFLSASGVSPAITCGTPSDLGCHNGKVTPVWNTATPIACTNCHTPGGSNVADPQTGLHNITVAGVQKHDSTLTDGSAVNGVGCTECHNATQPATHTDGVFNVDSAANNDRFLTRTNMTWADGAANSGTCSGTGLPSAGCHSDAGAWSRLWSTAANSTATAVGSTRCDVCHGQFGKWVAGTSHGATFGTTTSTRGQSHNSLGGATNACEDCHSYPSIGAKHNTATHLITMNQVPTNGVPTRATGRTYCSNCHTNDGDFATTGTHTFKTSVFAMETVAGANDPVGSCTGCHGGGTSGASSANYWPDGSNTNAENSPAQNKHLAHMTDLAAKRYGETIAQLLTDNGNGTSDTKQKALCDYCHRASAQDATHKNTIVEVFPVGYNKTLWNTADAVTLATYTAVGDFCSNVDCHNSKTTNVIDANHGWYGTGTTTCLMCHTVGGTGANPTTGLHNTTAGSMETGKRHDDTLKPASGCAACHGMPAIAPASTHIGGTFTADSGANTDRGLTGLYTDAAANTGTCSGGIAGAAGCHDGAGDAGSWARKWSNTADDGGTAGCANCHGGVAGAAWTFGADNVVGDGHVSHGRNWDTPQDVTAEVMPNHDAANKCNSCHVYPDAPYNDVWGTGNHGNNLIDMNSTTGYAEATWNCANSCHANNTAHAMEDSGWTVNPVAGPALACTSCHTGSGTNQFKVGATSSHTDPDGTGATYAAGGNHCAVCHFASHATETTNTIAVNWDTRTMGTSFVTGDGKLHLKNNIGGTTKTYEAEICWGCHWDIDVPSLPAAVKEFGNTQGAYQTGTLSQRNWFGATWTSANFAYKNGAINSFHQTQSAAGVNPAIDTAHVATDVGTIGCTACHDVHRVGNNGFTPAGAPYLRGSWTSNPFKEDGAPLSTQTMSSDRGAVPRGIGSAAANGLGGWQIEQNNASFTNTDYGTNATTSYAGLCSKCHTQAGLEGMTWSGHDGAVSGFTGNTSNNIFRTGLRDSTSSYQRGHMSYQGTATGRSGTWIGGLRNARQWNDGIAPADIDSLQTGGTTISYPAGAVTSITMDDTTYQNNFHNFPCSKCHSPHASRLPRLMITNCLDVKHNTWDDGQGIPKNWTPGTFTSGQLAYAATAQNCHRYVLGTDANRELNAEPGWNSVTPW